MLTYGTVCARTENEHLIRIEYFEARRNKKNKLKEIKVDSFEKKKQKQKVATSVTCHTLIRVWEITARK